MELTWKDVLNYKHKKGFGDMQSYVYDVVLPSGYPYFLWNDRVYIPNGKEYPKTTIFTIKDVE